MWSCSAPPTETERCRAGRRSTWSRRSPPYVAHICSPNLCWTAATKVRPASANLLWQRVSRILLNKLLRNWRGTAQITRNFSPRFKFQVIKISGKVGGNMSAIKCSGPISANSYALTVKNTHSCTDLWFMMINQKQPHRMLIPKGCFSVYIFTCCVGTPYVL